MILTAIYSSAKTVTLILFTLANGQVLELYDSPDTCLAAQIAFMYGDLYVEDRGIPRQKPIELQCKCAEVRE